MNTNTNPNAPYKSSRASKYKPTRKITRITKLEEAKRVFGSPKSPTELDTNHYYFIYDQRTDDFIRGSKTKLPIVILYNGIEEIPTLREFTASKKIILKPINHDEYLREYYTHDNLLFFETTKENLENDKVRLLTKVCIKNGIPYDCERLMQGYGITNKSNNQKKERRERRVSRKQRKRKRRRTIRRT
jgi:hypothetical protein